MRIEPWDPADEATERACYETYRDAQLADDLVEPPMSAAVFGRYLREGFEKNPGEVWVAAGAGGDVPGYYRINLPDLENRDRASGGPVVHPAARRHGIGRALLRHEAGRAAANGRAVLSGSTVEDSAGEAFARAVGAAPGITEVRRVQYLAKIPRGKIAELRESAARAATGYSLVSWAGEAPEKYLGPLAGVINAYADAPRGAGVEARVWDAERVRERTGTLVRARLVRSYSVAALHGATGEMAGFSGVLVDPATPEWGFQQLTAVTRAHRGHRIGLLLKTAMLGLLAAAEPGLDRIETGNAAGNKHMIAVNEQLGYEVVSPGWRFYEMPVAAIPGSG